jgi:hypothetical protein
VRIVTAAGMTALPIATAGATPAMAGTNGQHIKVCDIGRFSSVSVNGSNQSSHQKYTSWRVPYPNTCWIFTAYWFKHNVSVRWRQMITHNTNGFVWSIPANLRSTNTVTCYRSGSYCSKGSP